MKTKQSPKESLAKNLRYLMDENKYSEAALAKRSGVSQKGINKILNGNSSATLDTVEKLAAAFGLSLWHLIMPNLPLDLIKSKELENLYDNYASADKDGRKLVNHVAEREASYKVK